MFHQLTEGILNVIEVAALIIEVLAVAIIFLAVVWGLYEYLRHSFSSPELLQERFTEYKMVLGRALLLGLEILVAADIIKTVALETTFESVAVLGMLVIIRIFLGWSLIVEMEGRWPWQPERKTIEAAGEK
jgi:uncharacterized membrane protein